METGSIVTRLVYPQTWHGEHKCVYAYATSEMKQITKKKGVDYIE